MEPNNEEVGESAPHYPRPAGAQKHVNDNCQPPMGTLRSNAQVSPTLEDIDSDIALRRGLGYLHARDGHELCGLLATSAVLVDRPSRDQSSTSATERGFWSDDTDVTTEMTKPDVEKM